MSMDVWSRCLERLEAEFPPEDVHTWLKPLQADVRDDATVLYAPNAFIVEQVRERYLPRIRELVHYFAGHTEVNLEIGSRPKAFLRLPLLRSNALISICFSMVSRLSELVGSTYSSATASSATRGR